MTEWEVSLDDATPGQSGLAFIAFATAIAWLLCLPFDLCASFRRSTRSNTNREEADVYGAVEGFHNHSGEVH